jgi:hypothetical protein
MFDLVDKYFKEDLTEAEQAALEDSLLNSDEAALKFETLAKDAYVRYGLPEPQPHWGNSNGPFPSSGMGLKSILWVLGIGTALLLGLWRFHPDLPFLKTSTAITQTAPDLSQSAGDNGKPQTTTHSVKPVISNPAQATKDNSASHSTGLSGQNNRLPSTQQVPVFQKPALNNPPQRQVVSLSSANMAVNPTSRQVTPVNVDLNPPKTYPNLSVVVGQSQLGYLTVRVVNPQGVEVVGLYRGTLGPGNWIFQWDGKLSTGRGAKPGFYLIEVRSGTYVQRKSIQIQ